VNILALTSSYPRYEGDPTAPFLESIVRSLTDRGHEVDVVLPESSAWDRPASDGPIHYHPYRYSPRRSWTPWGYSAALEQGVRIKPPLFALAPIVAASAVRMARSVIASRAIDVVHAHWVVPNGALGALAAGRSGPPLVVTLHGSDAAISERSPRIERVTRWTFGRAAAVTAPSNDLLERARRLGAPATSELVQWGADAARFSQPGEPRESARSRLGVAKDETLVVAVGRLLPVKGFAYLVDAVAEAASELPSLRLVVVGDGDERSELERRATPLGPRVVFTGAVEPEQVPSYLAAADMVAVPSIHHEGYVDGLPNVVLEAMAAGKPVVASRVGGLRDVIRDGDNGVLVPEQDVGALAGAITRLARDPELRMRLGSAGQRLVRDELTWEAVGERLESVFERVVRP